MTQKKIKEVMFDWDGTLADTETVSIALARRVLSDYANSVFGNPMEHHLDGIDMRGKDFGQIAKLFQQSVNERLPDGCKITIDIDDLRYNKLRPLTPAAIVNAQMAPGIVEATAELQDDMGLGLAVVSNSPRLRIEPLIDKHGFDARLPRGRLFSAFEDTAGKLKDDPAIYLLAAKTLGITPEEAAAVEDSCTGMRAAKAAGIGLCIGYTGLADRALMSQIKDALLRDGADIVIDDMKELPAVIRRHLAP